MFEKAVILNEELSTKHSYTKLQRHLDYFQLTCTENYLDLDDYGRLSRKYTVGKDSDTTWAVRFRLAILRRFDDLKEYES